MKIQIITNKKVDKTFESEDCLLMRTIVTSTYVNGQSKFIIKTERCNYYDVETPLFNADGTPQLDANDVQLTELRPILKVLNKKDTESVVIRKDTEMDVVYEAIKGQVDITASGYSAFIDKVTQIGLLLGTQQDKPYGTLAEDWELLNS